MNLNTLFALAALLICLGEVHDIFPNYVPLKFVRDIPTLMSKWYIAYPMFASNRLGSTYLGGEILRARSRLQPLILTITLQGLSRIHHPESSRNL